MLDREGIKKIIPHREPFLFLDQITLLEPGLRGEGIYKVAEDAFWVPAHFPKYSVFPGVLQVEALAQLGSVVVLSQEEIKDKIAFFTGIDKARFRGQVFPGDKLEMVVNFASVRRNFGSGQATGTVNGKKVLEVKISYILAEPEKKD